MGVWLSKIVDIKKKKKETIKLVLFSVGIFRTPTGLIETENPPRRMYQTCL